MCEQITNTRRKLLAGVGTGLTAGLAGCSAFDSVTSSSDDDQTQDDEQGGSSAALKTDPEDSEWVSNGQLRVGPNVQVYNIWDLTPTSASIGFQAMPNPLSDYEVETYFTPLNQLPMEWKYRNPITRISGASYDSNNHVWEPEDTRNPRFELAPEGTVTAEEYGEKVASFTVPSGAAGLVSEEVDPPEGLTTEELPDEYYAMERINYLATEYNDWYTQLPSVGDRFDRRLYRANSPESGESGVSIVSRTEAVGTYPIDTQPVYYYPYIKDLELDQEIPDMTAGIFTFAWTEQPTVSPKAGEVVTQTGQFVRIGDTIQNPHSLGYQGIPHPTVDDPDKRPNPLDVTTQKFVLYYDDFNRPGFHTKVNRDNGTNVVKHFRISHYGRHSPELEEIAEMDSTRDDDPMKYAGIVAPNLIGGNVQNMWSIRYTVTEEIAYEALREGLDILQRESVRSLYLGDGVRQHEKVQEVAEKLKQVCNNIGAESKAAQLRVIADFVQYLPHIVEDYDELEKVWGDMSDVPLEPYNPTNLGGTVSHPVWTLYVGSGDCEDFTALFNAIASTEQFGIDVNACLIEGITRFNTSTDEDTVGHVTPSVPMEELGVNRIMTAGGDDDVTPLFVPGTYRDGGQKYAYIEASGPAPLGFCDRRISLSAPPSSV